MASASHPQPGRLLAGFGPRAHSRPSAWGCTAVSRSPVPVHGPPPWPLQARLPVVGPGGGPAGGSQGPWVLLLGAASRRGERARAPAGGCVQVRGSGPGGCCAQAMPQLPTLASGRGRLSRGLTINRPPAGRLQTMARLCSRGGLCRPWHSHQSPAIKSIRDRICANKETGAGAQPAAQVGGTR